MAVPANSRNSTGSTDKGTPQITSAVPVLSEVVCLFAVLAFVQCEAQLLVLRGASWQWPQPQQQSWCYHDELATGT